VPGCQKLQMSGLTRSDTGMLYSCTHMAIGNSGRQSVITYTSKLLTSVCAEAEAKLQPEPMSVLLYSLVTPHIEVKYQNCVCRDAGLEDNNNLRTSCEYTFTSLMLVRPPYHHRTTTDVHDSQNRYSDQGGTRIISEVAAPLSLPLLPFLSSSCQSLFFSSISTSSHSLLPLVPLYFHFHIPLR